MVRLNPVARPDREVLCPMSRNPHLIVHIAGDLLESGVVT